MHRLTNGIAASETERHVAHTATDEGVRQSLLDDPARFDVFDRVVVVLFEAGGYCKDIGIENDVFRGKPKPVGQDSIRALANLNLALRSVGLALLVERHDNGSRSITPDESGLLLKLFLSLFQADGVHDAFALDALESLLDYLPSRRVDHDRYATDVRLRRDQAQELDHRRFRIEEALVHVHVDHLGAVGNLLTCDVQGGLVISLPDELGKLCRPCHVGAFTDIGEQRIGTDVEWFEAAQATAHLDLGDDTRRDAVHGFDDCLDVGRCGPATTAYYVDEPALRKVADHGRHVLRGLVVLSELVWQSGVGMTAHKRVGDGGNVFEIRP